MQHDDLRVVKEPQGELRVADSAGDNQSRPLSKAAPGVLWAQTLSGGEHRPDPRENPLPAVGVAGQLQIKVILPVVVFCHGGEVLRIMAQHDLVARVLCQPGKQGRGVPVVKSACLALAIGLKAGLIFVQPQEGNALDRFDLIRQHMKADGGQFMHQSIKIRQPSLVIAGNVQHRRQLHQLPSVVQHFLAIPIFVVDIIAGNADDVRFLGGCFV